MTNDQWRRTGTRRLLLIFCSFRTSEEEVKALGDCLSQLSPEIGFAVVVNDSQASQPIDKLETRSDFFLRLPRNIGYGRAINRAFFSLDYRPDYIAAVNTDICWKPFTFETLLTWLDRHPDVSLAVPQILNPQGDVVPLCKKNPTLLALISRRFLPNQFKPSWLTRYDRWYCMLDRDYNRIFEASYLSGCCMLIKSCAFERVDGFDERFFLYLEDADLTRRLASVGRCVHLPIAAIVHRWGRGNYLRIDLMIVNFCSAFWYFLKWGPALW